MIYLKTQNANTKITKSDLFWCWGDVHEALFSPDTEQIILIDFKLHGKTYAERRENLLGIAIDFQLNESGDLFYSDYAAIGAWFEKNGKRYGLVKEFKENGIL